MLDRLEKYRRAITEIGAKASLRGEGSGAFVYSEKSGRAIEASLNNEEWWLEFWAASNDPDAQPQFDQTFLHDLDAIENSINWLNCSTC